MFDVACLVTTGEIVCALAERMPADQARYPRVRHLLTTHEELRQLRRAKKGGFFLYDMTCIDIIQKLLNEMDQPPT